MKSIVASSAVLSLTLGLFAEPWPTSVVSFEPKGALKSGDAVTITVTPPDVPESLGLSFARALYKNGRRTGKRQVVEFEGMPIKLVRESEGANVWTASFTVPFMPQAEELPAGDFFVSIVRYGKDTHYDGTDAFAFPQTVSFAAGENAAARTSLRIFDFGSEDAAVYFGAEPVTPSATPEGFVWTRKPQKWEKGRILQLDSLMHDWVASTTHVPIAFKLKVPDGKWRIAAGFGALGHDCWANRSYLPVAVEFSVNGAKVYERAGDERAAYALRDHEALPGEDLYGTYVEPVLAETELTAEPKDGELKFNVVSHQAGKFGTLVYLALWPADDAEAAERFAAVKARRRLSFENFVREIPPTDRYGVSPFSEYRAIAAEEAKKTPFIAALQNPYDWVLPEGELPETVPTMKVAAAKGERICGGVVLRSDVDLKDVVAKVEGFPAEVKVTPYKLMYFRFVGGVNRTHWIGPNHLLEGPRDVRKGLAYPWLVRFVVPQDAAAGTWRGRVVLSSGDWRREIPAELTVRPFRLPALSDYRIAAMGGDQGMEGTEESMRFARDELGCTTMHLFNRRLNQTRFRRDASGKIVGLDLICGLTPEEMDRRFKTYRACGFSCKAPYCGPQAVGMNKGIIPCGDVQPHSPEWETALKLVHDAILAIARSNGCETVTVDLGGEIGHDQRLPRPQDVAAVVDYCLTLKRLCPDILLTWRCNCIDSTRSFYGVLDVVGVRGKPSWDYVDDIGEFSARKPTYVYSQSGRFQNGIGGWYHGATGSFREWNCWRHDFEFDDFVCQGCCGTQNHTEAMPGPRAEGCYTLTQRGEAFRAGSDDIRYLRLLEQLIAAKETDPSAAATVAAAKRFRAFVRRAAGNAQVYYAVNDYGGPFRQDGGNDWPYLRLDLMREMIARYVAALRGGGAVDAPAFELPVIGERWLNLDDGPLAAANGGKLGGAFTVLRGFKGVSEVLLEGNGVKRTLPSVREPARYVKHYWKDDSFFRNFTVDTADLGPGVYTLTLLLDGKPADRTNLNLVKGL